jgi:hypothetical protein
MAKKKVKKAKKEKKKVFKKAVKPEGCACGSGMSWEECCKKCKLPC